jgi:hypothetical protein
LELVTSFIDKINATNKTYVAREKEINKERKAAVADILHLAHAHKVRPGKVCCWHFIGGSWANKISVDAFLPS